MVAQYDHNVTVENWALGWRWDIVLRAPVGAPCDEAG
jgi:hypothetical protein